MDSSGRHVSLDVLTAAFEREVVSDKRAAAETAYAISFTYRNHDVGGVRRFDLAKTWALSAIEILDSLPSGTVGEVASSRAQVGEISIPDLLHSGVVRQRLADVLI